MLVKGGIGKLDRRITIQRENVEVNTHYEQEILGWVTVVEVWANVKDEDSASNREYFIAEQITPRRTLEFTIRYRSGLNEKMRILFDDQYFNIISINFPDRRKTTVIKAYLLDET
jgi:SPP1 family predicted phage head-tail adaptor